MHPEAVGLPGHGGAVSITGESWRPLRRLRGAVDASLGDVLGAGKRSVPLCAAMRRRLDSERLGHQHQINPFQKENIR
jgi:hypothetical protein